MNSLTQKDEQGNWCLKGMRWEDFRPGKVLTKEMFDRVYGALWKLMEYEDTGLDPDDLEALCEGQREHRWISANPLDGKMPKHKETVLVSTWPEGVRKAWYGYNSKRWHFVPENVPEFARVTAWMPLPVPYEEGRNQE